ncbi:MAG: PIG-L family deacetylase [Chloroflexota bacterium]
MDVFSTVVEGVGHVMAIAAFIAVLIYVHLYRRNLRRTTRQSTILYWLILIGSSLSGLLNAARLFYMVTQGAEHLAPWLDLLSEYPSVIAQSFLIMILIKLKVASKEPGTKLKRILAIGAHPDDIEIACGGIMAKFHDAGHMICGLVMTRGEQGGNGEVRPQEAGSSAEFLGLDKVKILDLPDTRLNECAAEVREAIEAMVRELDPDMIFTHSIHDIHQDHRVVHEATLQAARSRSTILCYESPSVTSEFIPTLFVDISDYLDVKVESIKEHWDQRVKPYVQPERVRGQAIFRGGQARMGYAEGFEVVRAAFSHVG